MFPWLPHSSDLPKPRIPAKAGWLEPSLDEIAKIDQSVADYLEAWFLMNSPPEKPKKLKGRKRVGHYSNKTVNQKD